MRSFIVLAVTFLVLLEVEFFQSSMAQQISADVNHEEALRKHGGLPMNSAIRSAGCLFQELQRGGPASAVRVCSEVAQEMTREFNRHTGHHARRVSVRVSKPSEPPG